MRRAARLILCGAATLTGCGLIRERDSWTEPTPPTRIVGSIHYVGTEGLGVYLITTSEGHILLNGALEDSAPLIEASIRASGFRVEDIKWIISNHAHFDHVATHAYFKQRSGAQVAATTPDAELLESGGEKDFQYGRLPSFRFDRVKVDRILNANDTLRLGGVELIARHTPGHTKGGTTWITRSFDDRRWYTVVFPEGTSINPGYRLVRTPSYEGIAGDYQRSFAILDSLTPDIWLAAHTSFFEFHKKRTTSRQIGVAAWVDSVGYRSFIAEARAKFEKTVDFERRN